MTYAEGGTVSYANGKRIHTFADSGTLVVTEAGTVEALVVAGGGAGGGDYGHTGVAYGGGGGGGVIYTAALSVGLGNVAVVVGEGGVSMQISGGLGPLVDAQNSSISDGNVNFSTQTAIRGGTNNQDGGSGGGSSNTGAGGNGTAGQGNDGGNATNFFTGGAGGGGGETTGWNAPSVDFTDTAGNGGTGYLSSISGTTTRYGAGGGGGAWKDGYGIGGLGGGGDGGWASEDGTSEFHSGNDGTGYGAGGGGQGGAWGAGRTGGSGHKGVVIFSYDSDFTTGRRVAQNEDLADMTASTIKGRITTTGIPQDLTAAQVAGILDAEITERAQDAIGAMVADTATIDLTYTDGTPELKADVNIPAVVGLGSEEITNGGFTSDASDWTLGAGWTWVGEEQVQHTAGNIGTLKQTGELIDNEIYLITVAVAGTVGTVEVLFGGGDSVVLSPSYGFNVVIGIVGRWYAGSGYKVSFLPSSDFDGFVSTVSMKKQAYIQDTNRDALYYGRKDGVWSALDTAFGALSGTLAQFAATTSLELKGVISDETGSGALVFGTSPTLTAPVIGNFFYANHTHAASGVTGGTLASATGLPLTTGVTGILPAARRASASSRPNAEASNFKASASGFFDIPLR